MIAEAKRLPPYEEPALPEVKETLLTLVDVFATESKQGACIGFVVRADSGQLVSRTVATDSLAYCEILTVFGVDPTKPTPVETLRGRQLMGLCMVQSGRILHLFGLSTVPARKRG